MSDTLHHEDGTHWWTPPSADGHLLELHEAAIRRHVADGHEHPCPTCPTCGGPDYPEHGVWGHG